jgi:hypothetical protein
MSTSSLPAIKASRTIPVGRPEHNTRVVVAAGAGSVVMTTSNPLADASVVMKNAEALALRDALTEVLA